MTLQEVVVAFVKCRLDANDWNIKKTAKEIDASPCYVFHVASTIDSDLGFIKQRLEKNRWHSERTANEVGLSRRTMYRIINKFKNKQHERKNIQPLYEWQKANNS